MGRDRTGEMRRSVTAFFDERAAAQQAVDDLAAAGIARERITLVEGGARPVAVDPLPSAAKGLWSTVKDLFMADEDRHAYGEGLRRGGFLLCVATAGDEARIVEILDREGAVDMDARQGDWELEGWDPARAASDLGALAEGGAPAAAAARPEARAAALRAAVEPAVPVGPALAPGEVSPGGAGGGRRIVRDSEAEGLRLRTYVEAHDHPDPLR